MADENQSEYEFLKSSPAFDGLSDQDIKTILSKAKPMEVRGERNSFGKATQVGQCMSLLVVA